jgi:hypothetical protein
MSSQGWFVHIQRAVKDEALNAVTRAGLTMADVSRAAVLARDQTKGSAIPALLSKAANESARLRMEKLVKFEQLSLDETRVERDKPRTMTDTMNAEQFIEDCRPHGGVQRTRPARRHCIYKSGDPSLPRCIDNLRDNDSNDTATVWERVDLPSFLWPIHAACLLVMACFQLGLRVTAIGTFLDDMASAYRMAPSRSFPRVSNITCWFSFIRGCVVFQRVYGHFYGAKAANNNFSRIPRIVVPRYTLLLPRHR